MLCQLVPPIKMKKVKWQQLQKSCDHVKKWRENEKKINDRSIRLGMAPLEGVAFTSDCHQPTAKIINFRKRRKTERTLADIFTSSAVNKLRRQQQQLDLTMQNKQQQQQQQHQHQ